MEVAAATMDKIFIHWQTVLPAPVLLVTRQAFPAPVRGLGAVTAAMAAQALPVPPTKRLTGFAAVLAARLLIPCQVLTYALTMIQQSSLQ